MVLALKHRNLSQKQPSGMQFTRISLAVLFIIMYTNAFPAPNASLFNSSTLQLFNSSSLTSSPLQLFNPFIFSSSTIQLFNSSFIFISSTIQFFTSSSFPHSLIHSSTHSSKDLVLADRAYE